MGRSTKHIVASSVVCALTLGVFLAFYGRLPESIPVQFSLTGAVGSYWPREAVVFGVPAVCVAVDVAAGVSISRNEDARAWMYWIVPVISFAVTGLILLVGTR